jgi:medium-chain acyl-[acyl-carrier-protein] hydrolase
MENTNINGSSTLGARPWAFSIAATEGRRVILPLHHRLLFMAWNQDWVVYPKPRPDAKLRLFCFPYAGVGASAFRGWADHADPTIEVCPIQTPGRENRLREQSISSMTELVPRVVEAVCPLLDVPYALYGHSLGARVALETARAVRKAGLRGPAHLFVGACGAPQLGWHHPSMRELTDRELLTEIHNRYGGTPSQIIEDPELWPFVVPALRADVTVLETYRYQPEPALTCPITAFYGIRDGMVTSASVGEWRHQTVGAFRCEEIDGNHFFTQPARQRLLEAIATVVEPLKNPLSTCASPGTRQ